jgi:hypothetical protein
VDCSERGLFFESIQRKLKYKLDVHSAGGRMRATSAMKLFKNFLLINKLSLKEGLQSEVRRVECAPVDRVVV